MLSARTRIAGSPSYFGLGIFVLFVGTSVLTGEFSLTVFCIVFGLGLIALGCAWLFGGIVPPPVRGPTVYGWLFGGIVPPPVGKPTGGDARVSCDYSDEQYYADVDDGASDHRRGWMVREFCQDVLLGCVWGTFLFSFVFLDPLIAGDVSCHLNRRTALEERIAVLDDQLKRTQRNSVERRRIESELKRSCSQLRELELGPEPDE